MGSSESTVVLGNNNPISERHANSSDKIHSGGKNSNDRKSQIKETHPEKYRGEMAYIDSYLMELVNHQIIEE